MPRLLLIAMFTMLSLPVQAQGELIELRKDPFRQPDMLQYQSAAPVDRQRLGESGDDNENPQLRLTATLISVSEPMVIVNDQLLHIGDEIQGMRLILIDEGRAIFRHQGKNLEITLDETDAEAQAEPEE